MSTKYKHSKDVPTSTLADRLDELATTVTKGDTSPFVMRVPAELDYCPDLVMSAAARRLRVYEDVLEVVRDQAADDPDIDIFIESLPG